MNEPFGIVFLKKAELYYLIRRLDKKADVDNQDKNQNNPNTWTVEKNIFKWTYHNHRHLGTAITSDFFKYDNKDSKLEDWGLLENKEIKKGFEYVQIFDKNIRENMVVKGFADFVDSEKSNIIINKEGLLIGEVIDSVEGGRFPVRWIYWIYGGLIDYVGAWILLLLILIPSIIILISSIINIFCK